MGEDLKKIHFTKDDEAQFRHQLMVETNILKKKIEEGKVSNAKPLIGLELEAWLVDRNFQPEPSSDSFIGLVQNEKVVPEISKFNFELNTDPFEFSGACFSKIYEETHGLWKKCETVAKNRHQHSVLIGTLATLRPQMLSLDVLSPQNRYFAMNERVMNLRHGKNAHIHLKQDEDLDVEYNSVIAECAATSLQVHLGVNLQNVNRYYNASVIASALVVGVAANAPYLLGKEVWDESRVGLFEQAVEVDSFRNEDGEIIRRVGFGNGYINQGFLELFLENLNGHAVLLPQVMNDNPESLHHLRLHNGTIWRWNRPIVQVDKDGVLHMRIEHRTPSAGPTVKDGVANAAFYLGLVEYLANLPIAPESNLDFKIAKQNFYEACKHSYDAKITWIDGKEYILQDLVLNHLMDHLKRSLEKKGVHQNDINEYLGIIHARTLSGMNGAKWQKAYIHTHGPRFQEMLKSYVENQYSEKPVHLWGLD